MYARIEQIASDMARLDTYANVHRHEELIQRKLIEYAFFRAIKIPRSVSF